MSRLRLGLIGCGNMGHSHMRRFEFLRHRMAVTGAADIAEAARAATKDLLPDAKVVADYEEILDDVDAVLIAIPHHLHHRVTLDCLRAGKHVLLEKPMANSERECLDIIEAADKAGRKLMVAYCMRFHPLVVRMKELIDEKAYGECFQVSIWTEQHTEGPPGHWYHSAEKLGGGQFFSHGCHYVDILLWYLGRPVRGTHFGTRLCTPWMEGEGTSNAIVQFEGGRLGYHFGTWGARGTRLRYSFHAHCERGMIEAVITDKRLFAHVGRTQELLFECDPGKHTENELAHFLDCIETGREPLTNGRAALQSLRVIWRLYEAEQKNGLADLRGLGLEQA